MRTTNDPGLQCSLVARLRRALLLEDLLQVVVYKRLGALGYGSSQLLQARRHGRLPARVERGLAKVEVGSEALPVENGWQRHWGSVSWGVSWAGEPGREPGSERRETRGSSGASGPRRRGRNLPKTRRAVPSGQRTLSVNRRRRAKQRKRPGDGQTPRCDSWGYIAVDVAAGGSRGERISYLCLRIRKSASLGEQRDQGHGPESIACWPPKFLPTFPHHPRRPPTLPPPLPPTHDQHTTT
jgi:hypothetical protein